MSDSSPAPPPQLQEVNTNEHDADREGPTVKTVKLGIFYVLLLAFFVALYNGGEEIGSFLKEYKEVITALATILIALFTGTLFFSTDSIRKDGKATARVMAAQQKAMEATATAMEQLAAAAAESAKVAKRGHVSQNPPVLRLLDMKIIDNADGPPSITFSIANDGDTDATILRTKTSDGFVHRPTKKGLSGTPVENDPSLIGKTIKPRHTISGSHPCSCASFESAYVGVSGGDASTVLLFGGYIGVLDENRQYRLLNFAREWIASINCFSDHDYAG